MDEGELSEGDIHDVLRNARRRLTIERLRESGGTLSVRELSEQIAADETGETPPPRNIRQSVYVSLHQTHLPKLDDLGIVDYDADSKTVDLRERAADLEAYTRLANGGDPPWALFYLGVGLLGLLTMGLVLLGVPLVSAVPPALWAILYLLAVVVAAAVQLGGADSSPLEYVRE